MEDAHSSEIPITPSLRLLLEDVIDYAGAFPPASLPLSEAIKNFARYRLSPEAWMLGRFVVQASRLSDLDALAGLFADEPPFRFSVLAGRGDEPSMFVDELTSDVGLVASFRQRHGRGVSIDALEMRIPEDLLTTDVVRVGRFLADVDAVLAAHDLRNADMFFEVALDQNHRQTTPIVAGALNSFNRNRTIEEHGSAGVKMRTGGTEADAFPSADSLAFGIAACRDAGIPFKATAGLHHPVRHFSQDLDVVMHGFLNLFVAAVLATAEHSKEADLVSVLMEDDGHTFVFTEDGIEWKGHRANIDVIRRTRRDYAASFGSCSFTEPIEDLHALGLL